MHLYQHCHLRDIYDHEDELFDQNEDIIRLFTF